MLLMDKAPTSGIDLGADPVFVPEGFEVVEHMRGAVIEWNPTSPLIELYLPAAQRKGILAGEKVFQELAAFNGMPVNANALDYFLANLFQKPWIIPEAWKRIDNYASKHILFWGTRYKFEDGICVRSLDWSADARDRGWKAGYCWVENYLNAQFPAAMLRGPAIKTNISLSPSDLDKAEAG
jgi:hypothetical protein